MYREFRILEVRRGHVWAQSLDAVQPKSLKIVSASKYIENEVIVAEPPSDGRGDASQWGVIASRVDPSFIGGDIPKITAIDHMNECEFTE